jgi:hypothetical protein
MLGCATPYRSSNSSEGLVNARRALLVMQMVCPPAVDQAIERQFPLIASDTPE